METVDHERAVQMEATVLVKPQGPAEVLVGPFRIVDGILGSESS